MYAHDFAENDAKTRDWKKAVGLILALLTSLALWGVIAWSLWSAWFFWMN